MRVTSFLWASLIGVLLCIPEQRVPDTNPSTKNDHYFVAFVRDALEFYKNPEHVPQSSMEARKYTNGSPRTSPVRGWCIDRRPKNLRPQRSS